MTLYDIVAILVSLHDIVYLLLTLKASCCQEPSIGDANEHADARGSPALASALAQA